MTRTTTLLVLSLALVVTLGCCTGQTCAPAPSSPASAGATPTHD